MTEEIPEVLPQPIVDEHVELVLLVTAYEQDGYAMASVWMDNAWGGSAIAQARQTLGADSSSRYAGMVRVRVPRALLRERWTK